MESKEDGKESKQDKVSEAPSAKSVAISGGYEQIYVILKSESADVSAKASSFQKKYIYIYIYINTPYKFKLAS